MEGKIKYNHLRMYFRIFGYIVLLSVLYFIGTPWPVVIFLGFLFFTLMLLKSKLYKKIDSFLGEEFPVLSEQRPFVRKIVIFVCFILIYLALKQIIYATLNLFGLDVQKIISDSINQSIGR